MVCEGLLNYFGTSSEEIAEKAAKKTQEQAKQFYQPQIDKLINENHLLLSELSHARQLLAQNNIVY